MSLVTVVVAEPVLSCGVGDTDPERVRTFGSPEAETTDGRGRRRASVESAGENGSVEQSVPPTRTS